MRTRSRKPEIQTPSAWESLGLSAETLAVLSALKFEKPTDIQRELIPPALSGRDVLGQAKTGTGKTAAFSIPILERIDPDDGLQAMILVPTRELAVQVEDHVRALAGAERGIKSVAILGGRAIKEQASALKAGAQVAIGTPGRVLDLIGRKLLPLDGLRVAVLDEVDRMLDIGFRDDIRKILGAIKQPHQTIFVSATMDNEIMKLAKSYMRDPLELNVSRDATTVEGIRHGIVTVAEQDKTATLLKLLEAENPTLVIVFTNTKHKARRVAKRLKEAGVNCKEIHGDLMQERRDRVMKSFRESKIHVLVATDLASRGLDVLNVSHIVNYDAPEDSAAYLHRIGRTGRMGRDGYAVMFVTPEEGKHLTEIEKRINHELELFTPPWLVTTNLAPSRATEAPPPPPANGDGIVVPTRFLSLAARDAVLEEDYGIKPKPRTLGSRFPTARKFRK